MLNKNFMIWRAILIAGMVIGVAGIVGEMVWSAEKGKSKEEEARQVIAMATSAKIGLEGAMQAALESVAGQVVEARLEKNGDKIAWNVEILTTDEAIMTVSVDAVSGFGDDDQGEGRREEADSRQDGMTRLVEGLRR